MKKQLRTLVLALVPELGGQPPELARAHRAYDRAMSGAAGALTVADLEPARLTLGAADRACADEDLEVARNLAVIAQRRIELAEARAAEGRSIEDDLSEAAPRATASAR